MYFSHTDIPSSLQVHLKNKDYPNAAGRSSTLCNHPFAMSHSCVSFPSYPFDIQRKRDNILLQGSRPRCNQLKWEELIVGAAEINGHLEFLGTTSCYRQRRPFYICRSHRNLRTIPVHRDRSFHLFHMTFPGSKQFDVDNKCSTTMGFGSSSHCHSSQHLPGFPFPFLTIFSLLPSGQIAGRHSEARQRHLKKGD